MRRRTERIWKQQDAEGLSWAALVVVVSGLGIPSGNLRCWYFAGDFRDRRACRLREDTKDGRTSMKLMGLVNAAAALVLLSGLGLE